MRPAELELQRLRAVINRPLYDDFCRAVVREAIHQTERWGPDHDNVKTPADWFWLIGYLAGKALAAHIAGNTEKAKHHTISSAGALMHWHAAICGRSLDKGDLESLLNRPPGDPLGETHTKRRKTMNAKMNAKRPPLTFPQLFAALVAFIFMLIILGGWVWRQASAADPSVKIQVLAPDPINEEAVAAMQIGYDQQVGTFQSRQANPLGLPRGTVTETLRGGSPLPELAIMLSLYDLVAEEARAWKAQGIKPSGNVFRCPSSGDRIYIEHGDRVACRCGVHFELYGNGLAMWRETPDEIVAGRRRRQEP